MFEKNIKFQYKYTSLFDLMSKMLKISQDLNHDHVEIHQDIR